MSSPTPDASSLGVFDLTSLMSLQPTNPRTAKVSTPSRKRETHTSNHELTFAASPRSALKVNRKKNVNDPNITSRDTPSKLKSESSNTTSTPPNPTPQTPSGAALGAAREISSARAKKASTGSLHDCHFENPRSVPNASSDELANASPGFTRVSVHAKVDTSLSNDNPSEDRSPTIPTVRARNIVNQIGKYDLPEELQPSSRPARSPSKPGVSSLTASSKAGKTRETAIEIFDSESEKEIVPSSSKVLSLPHQPGQGSGVSRSIPQGLSFNVRSTGVEEMLLNIDAPEDEWTDGSGVIGFAFDGSPKKMTPSSFGTPSASTASGKPHPAGLPEVTTGIHQNVGRLLFGRMENETPTKPNTHDKPSKGHPKVSSRVPRNRASHEIIEISSDDNNETIPRIIDDTENNTPPLSSPSKPRAAAKKRLPPAGASSPAGKGKSKAAKAQQLDLFARELFEELNDEVFGGVLTGCELTWSKLLSSTAGRAHLKKERDGMGAVKLRPDGSVIYSLKIELSTKVIDTEERILNTLSHEMCHLATWLVDGVGCSDHGAAWKTWTKKVQSYRADIKIDTRHTYEISYKYSWQCSNSACQHVYGRFSKSIDVATQGCGLCQSPLIALFETSKPKSAYQEFMKENIKAIRDSNPGMKQSEALKVVAEKWKAAKNQIRDPLDDLVDGLGGLAV